MKLNFILKRFDHLFLNDWNVECMLAFYCQQTHKSLDCVGNEQVLFIACYMNRVLSSVNMDKTLDDSSQLLFSP